MNVQAVVFDAFETLFVNRKTLWMECFARICGDQKLSVDPDVLFQACMSTGLEFGQKTEIVESMTESRDFVTYRDLWRASFVQAFNDLGVAGDAEEAVNYFFQDLSIRPAFPETFGVLKHLRGRMPIAVLSNADDTFLYGVLRYHGLDDAFNVVLSSEEAHSYKPHSDIYLRLERIGTPPETTVMVGDNLVDDIYGSHLVGMPAAWINRYGAPMDGPVKPTYELQSLEDLIPIVLSESKEV